MKGTQGLSFRRLSKPDEDGLIRIAVRAQNETIAAAGEGYTSPALLHAFAETLHTFPEQVPASTAFSAASGSCSIAIALETLDRLGHVGVKISIQEGTTPQQNTATLWLNTEPGALMNLGRQLRGIADLSSETAELTT